MWAAMPTERPPDRARAHRGGAHDARNGEAVVRVENLHKSFGDLEVLKGVDMEIDKGEVIVVFGRSGSGKSTLLRCINFLEEPTEGTIEVSGLRIEGGHRIRSKREQIRQLRMRCGMVFQQFNLFPHMTAVQNVMEGPVNGQGPPRRLPPAGSRWSSSTAWVWPTRPRSIRSACREDSSNASRSRAHWRWNPM